MQQPQACEIALAVITKIDANKRVLRTAHSHTLEIQAHAESKTDGNRCYDRALGNGYLSHGHKIWLILAHVRSGPAS